MNGLTEKSKQPKAGKASESPPSARGRSAITLRCGQPKAWNISPHIWALRVFVGRKGATGGAVAACGFVGEGEGAEVERLRAVFTTALLHRETDDPGAGGLVRWI